MKMVINMIQNLVICPSNYKMKMLLDEDKNSSLHSMKFMSKKEFIEHYYFSYDWNTIYYLISNYHFPVDVCKIYLEYLYTIEDKEYSSPKLCFLRDLKKELINEHLLTFSPSFISYYNNCSIQVSSLYELQKYEEDILHHVVDVEDVELNLDVHQFSTIEEEVHFVCVKIRELIKKGVSFSHIFLSNVNEDYYYILEKMFSYYQIPIEIPFHHSIYSTKIVQDYLETGDIDLEQANVVTKMLCDVLGEVALLEDGDAKREILIDLLKHTYLPNPTYLDAVRIESIDTYSFTSDDYVFVLGFNQDILPRIDLDIDYLSDSEKEEIGIYSSTYCNHRRKKVLAYLLSKIPNLTLSYKLSSPFQKYYPSSMINDYHLNVLTEDIFDREYSNLYNKIRYGEMLDTYYLYGEKNPHLDDFYSQYDISYNTFSSQFSGISKDLYLEHLSYPLRLSYTSLNAYNECRFKYYVQYVLKLSSYEDTFAATIGSLYHKILSLYKKEGFQLDSEWKKYLENKDLKLKDTVLLVRIRKDLEELLQVLKEQQNYTSYDQEYYEKELKVKVRDDISVEFVGYVDKIMTYQNISDTYFSIIDYKTGTIDTHIEPMKYGLHMQLPIYLYLLYHSNIFDNPIFTGIYYQNILFSYPTWSNQLEQDKKDLYKLKGYSTDDSTVLEKFDSTYQDSSYIKSMKYDIDKGYSRYSKILTNDILFKIIQYTKNEIENRVEDILNADFKINPKIYGKENISCKYCNYHDICFYQEKDYVYLDKVDDFSFLGGDE